MLTVETLKRAKLRHLVKFRQIQLNRGRDMAIFRFSTFHCAKFGWNRCGSFDNMQILVICDFGFKTPIHAAFGRFGGQISSKKVTDRSNPKKDGPLAEPRDLSHKA